MAIRMQLPGYAKYRTRYVLLVLPFYLFTFLPLCAQEFGMRWIYHPQAEETRQIWFKRNIHMDKPLASAILSVASEGRYIVYVNGYNISTDLFSSNPRGAIGVRDYEIGNFLHKGTNTIAVWYSPVNYTKRQLYIVMSGQWEDGSPFFMDNEKGWLCHTANARTLPDGNEEIDGPGYMANWNDYDWKEDSFLLSEWQRAEVAKDLKPAVITFCRHEKPAYRTQRILKRSTFSQQGRTLTYDFGQSFNGWVRVTMRGMKKGDVITVNGLRYICKGGTDDQACRRFTISTAGIARIILPAGRSRSNITTVEAICINDIPSLKP